MNNFSEDALVEQPAVRLFESLGWETMDCYSETYGINGALGRETRSDVVLVKRLKTALRRLNDGIDDNFLDIAIEELIHDRSTMTLEGANSYIYKLLKDGIKITSSSPDGTQYTKIIKIIDWEHPNNNDFFLAQQFWITGEMYTKRADLVGFVNGIPLVFIELKAAHNRIQDAFDNNLRDYKNTIPQIFWYNGLIILSNGSEAKIGSITAGWEHFSDWKKINNEGEHGIVQLETVIKGVCEKQRLLDLIENFIIYSQMQGGLVKLIAKNHQYLGVNNALQAVEHISELEGRLGVFWHTQGSGKTVSMMCLSQKVLRRLPGNWTFVFVTDRNELDDQLYKTFADSEVVTEPQQNVRANSRDHLRTLLQEDHRYIFTTLQKFWIGPNQEFPKLTDRKDIIVITDEAHRSQYQTYALNMRNAMPHASFLGFTGTPLILGDNVTKEVFGEYVSVYNFKESIEDKATVPLYYENRIPEVQLKQAEFDKGLTDILENAELDPEQEKRLEREFATQYQIITRDERLDKVAADIVDHFIDRGFMGKAMVMSIDKTTAVRMYDKVKKIWIEKITGLQGQLNNTDNEDEQERLKDTIVYMQETDMAVVVSPGQNENEPLKKYGLDITPHRLRMNNEDLDTKFKDGKDPLRIVFLCAMWMTGFDVPHCSTLYIDKPMKNHSLMQALARANRVFPGKTSGMIVDYVGIFQNIRSALAIYGEGPFGSTDGGDMPVADKSLLIDELRKLQQKFVDYFERMEINLLAFQEAKDFELIKVLDDTVDVILRQEEDKREFIAHHNSFMKLFKAILPDKRANEFARFASIVRVIARKVSSLMPQANIEHIRDQIEHLLDQTIIPNNQQIRDRVKEGYKIYDISQLNVEKLREKIGDSLNKNTEIEIIKRALAEKLGRMVETNRTRLELKQKFEKLIQEYNDGKYDLESFIEELIRFSADLSHEEQRAVSEQISEEELAVMDLLTKPKGELSAEERKQVKEVSIRVLNALKSDGCLSLDWRKKQQGRARVVETISSELDHLPESYDRKSYAEACNAVFVHVYDTYYGPGQNSYSLRGTNYENFGRHN